MNNTEKHEIDLSKTLGELLSENGAIFPTRLIANHPHIVEKICLLWRDAPEITHYFSELLTTHRHHRAGFPPEVHREIFLLSNYYYATHPSEKKSDNFWSGIDTR